MRRPKSCGFTIIESTIVLAIIGLLSAVAVPNLMTFSGRARQSEAKLNLKGFFASEKAYFAEHNTYACRARDGSASQCGFEPEKQTTYSYQFGSMRVPAQKPRQKDDSCVPEGARPGDGTGFVAAAAANIDRDAACDNWTINQDNQLINTKNDLELK